MNTAFTILTQEQPGLGAVVTAAWQLVTEIVTVSIAVAYMLFIQADLKALELTN